MEELGEWLSLLLFERLADRFFVAKCICFLGFQSDNRLSSLDDGLPLALRSSTADHRGLTVAVRQAPTVTSGYTKSAHLTA